MLDVRFTVSFPETLTLLKREIPLLGTRLLALIYLLKAKHGMQYHIVREKQRHILVLIRRGSDLKYILKKSIVFFMERYVKVYQ